MNLNSYMNLIPSASQNEQFFLRKRDELLESLLLHSTLAVGMQIVNCGHLIYEMYVYIYIFILYSYMDH